MSQSPITVTYTLEQILTRLEGKMDKLSEEVNQKIDKLSEEMDGKIDKLDQKIDKLSEETNHKIDKLSEEMNGKIDKLDRKIEKKSEETNQKIDNLQKDVNELKVGQAKLGEKVEGLGKRLEFQEFINRGIFISLIVAILGGAAKLLGWVGNTP